jgi:hypothetical protein
MDIAKLLIMLSYLFCHSKMQLLLSKLPTVLRSSDSEGNDGEEGKERQRRRQWILFPSMASIANSDNAQYPLCPRAHLVP